MASYDPQESNDGIDLAQSVYERRRAAYDQPNRQESLAHQLLTRGLPQNYYGQASTDSPVTGLDDYPPPAAPTPPSNFNRSSQFPPGMGGGLGAIGTMPSGTAQKNDQSANLLNLLKNSGSMSGSNQQSNLQSSPHNLSQSMSFDSPTNIPPQLHAPIPMLPDPQGLLANLIKGNMHNETAHATRDEPTTSGHLESWNTGPPSMDTQQYLLNLLHRPKPSQTDQRSATETNQHTSLTPQSTTGPMSEYGKEYSQQHEQGFPDIVSHEASPHSFQHAHKEHVDSPSARHEYSSPASHHSQYDGSRKPNRLDYTSPIEEHAVSLQQNQPSKTSTPGTSAPAPSLPTELPAPTAFEILKKTPSATSSTGHGRDYTRLSSQRSPFGSPENAKPMSHYSPSGFERKHGFSPAAASPLNDARQESNRETVSEAMADLAEKADMEAREALERAEDEEIQANIAAELEEMMSAKTDADFQKSATALAMDIKKELDKDEHTNTLEDQYPPELAQTIRDIVEDAAHGPVADSWESAEADEIIVIEERPDPVTVFNFPMKPWISISMQETEEPEQQFRDEVIMDIARLKKDFDQIDRNLVSATGSCIAYGMSKQGGFRVIRQDDGRDAKLFTDTKDRIFNIAVCTSPPDSDNIPQESIIGTGISGTVYYAQVKSGDKDHLEDASLEQYGFALPPVSAQEGDAPGGTLKTRARTSSIHPEFFAVGRGKTISIIWPAFVLRKSIFKPGNERVVDTERLYKECALRINTGKAGKDFTFSQDDTTIVSLDKSGRVKFWDVRDLTAADENSDLRYPMPAQTSLEVKEPLMTLNTTPEGEKAWPTSVILLDKQRPYQKRCALRYMIVGMKQNHTLQLWDLALGKPVQEFNLPHSKESDAVCSVMYHPPTGMIIVGHPTRNSIYLLHLSAPKYTIKGLSQVDYVQKLVAKDSSIPEPDSTAVISGVREYSFSNKGVLRSLDILVSPTAAQDSGEPTLFDLYAMHSKGVTCLYVKQHELGWTQDNKVIKGLDATDEGLVKISKLKELPSAIVTEPSHVDDVALPIRIAARPSIKETASTQPTPLTTGPEPSRRQMENNASQTERKDVEAPVTPNNQADKSEKKTRKKREKAAAAASSAEKLVTESTQSNGNSHSPRIEPVSSKSTDPKTVQPSAQPIMSAETIQSVVKQISSGLNDKLAGLITSEFKEHRGRVENEFRTRQDSFVKSQEGLLEIVSQTLNDNVQAVLDKIICDQFEESVVPHLSGLIVKTLETQLDTKVGGKVSHSIQNQMQKSLPNAVSQALQKLELSRSISDKLVENVSVDMEESFRETLMSTITPIFSDMAVAASRGAAEDVHRRTAEHIEKFERRHIADNHKIDQLTVLVVKLADTVNSMASDQAQLHDSLLKIQQQISRDRSTNAHSQPAQSIHTQHTQAPSQAPSYGSPAASSTNQLVPFPGSVASSSKDAELQHMIASVATFMEAGEYETGLVRWIQLPRKHEIFDQYIVKFSPHIMRDMPALVSLSVASVIAEQLDGPLLREKVGWVEIVLTSLHSALPHVNDPAVRDVIPNIMGTFVERIEKLYMQINSRSPADLVLRHLSQMTLMATRIRDYSRGGGY